MNKFKCLKLVRKLRSIRERWYTVSTEQGESHLPVMVNEVIEHIGVKDGDTVLDMTFGAGGHSKNLLDKYPNLKIIALDRDPVAHEFALNLQKEYPQQVFPLLGKFSELPQILEIHNVSPGSLDGVLCDLGCSSMQFDTPERGFSVNKSGPLDMRMDGDRVPGQITAADVVNYASEQDLRKILRVYGGEKRSRSIARAIVQVRTVYKPFQFTEDLSNMVEVMYPQPKVNKLGRTIHPATKVFQALRMFVNNEINELNYGLFVMNYYLKEGGKGVVLTFHSGEDIVVKRHFQGHIFDHEPLIVSPRHWTPILDETKEFQRLSKKLWEMDNKKVIVPDQEEVTKNPRSRSAKLRVATKMNDLVNAN